MNFRNACRCDRSTARREDRENNIRFVLESLPSPSSQGWCIGDFSLDTAVQSAIIESSASGSPEGTSVSNVGTTNPPNSTRMCASRTYMQRTGVEKIAEDKDPEIMCLSGSRSTSVPVGGPEGPLVSEYVASNGEKSELLGDTKNESLRCLVRTGGPPDRAPGCRGAAAV